MTPRVLSHTFCWAMLGLLSGCVSAPPPPPAIIAIRAKIPVIANVGESKSAQEKGGIEITLVPAAYATVKGEKYSVQPRNATIGSMLGASLATGGNSQNLIYVDETLEPTLTVSPDRLEFQVRVNNKLPRVFRGQGAVVQFNVAGNLIPFGDTDYKNLLEGIVPPRNESTFRILGPRIESLPDKTTVGIFLYDVVTQTDAAGNVTERQNFEWYFDYSIKEVEERGELKHGTNLLTPAQFQEALLKSKQANPVK